jgi:hypothetical protein
MSIGSLGMIGSLAATPLAQKSGEVDTAKAEAGNQQRAADANQRADSAAGIGVTQGDSQTSERDADGRRLWETTAAAKKPAEQAAGENVEPPRSKDVTGTTGNQLDLSG